MVSPCAVEGGNNQVENSGHGDISTTRRHANCKITFLLKWTAQSCRNLKTPQIHHADSTPYIHQVKSYLFSSCSRQPFWPTTACNFCLLLAGGGSPAVQRHPRGTPVVGCHGHWMGRPWLRTAMNCEVKRLESYDTCRDKPSQWDCLILGTKQHKFLTIHLPSRYKPIILQVEAGWFGSDQAAKHWTNSSFGASIYWAMLIILKTVGVQQAPAAKFHTWSNGCVWKCCEPHWTQWLMIIIPFLNGYNWEYTLFSDKPQSWSSVFLSFNAVFSWETLCKAWKRKTARLL